MNKYNLLFIFLILVFLFLSIFSVSGFKWNNLKESGSAITSDEVAHIGSGFYYLKTGKYFLNPEHPPLIKDVAALPLLFLNPRLPQEADEERLVERNYPFMNMYINKGYEIDNSQWHFSQMFIFGNKNPDLIVMLSRISLAVFNAALLAVLGIGISKLFGKRAALVLLFLVSFSPFMLINGVLVIMDFTSSVLQVLALIYFAILLKYQNSRKYMLISVAFTALALLAKFSSAILLPVMFLTGSAFIIFKRQKILEYLKMFTVFSILTLLFTGIFYSFHVFNMTPEDSLKHFDAHLFNFKDTPVRDLFQIMVSQKIPLIRELLKGIAYYMFGVLMVVNRIAGAAQRTYFLGGVYGSEGAGWTYWPVLFFTKFHLMVLTTLMGLTIYTVYKLIRLKPDLKKIKELYVNKIIYVALSMYLIFYMAYTFRSPLQIGLRHIMPVIFILFVFLAIGISKLWDRNLKKIHKALRMRDVFIAGGIMMILSAVLTFPHYLSYYNILGGGTDKGYKIATDSNYDWGGQDLKLLGNYVREKNIDVIYTHIFTNAPEEYYLGNGVVQFDIAKDKLPPSGSYIAVSLFEYMNNVYGNDSNDRKYTKIDGHRIDQVGKTIYIYQIP